MKAFLTGSHVYGTPGSNSDVDLVVMVDDEDFSKVKDLSDSVRTVRFGRLNLILCQSETEFAAWRMTTDRLRKIKKETGVTFDKDAAHVHFEEDRESVGVHYKGDSGENWSPEDSISKLI